MGIGLHIDLEEIDRVVILRIGGRLDAGTAHVLERRIDGLIEEGITQIALDCSGIDYLSSAGMRIFLSTSKKLLAKHGVLSLFSLNDDAGEILKIAGFDRILRLFATEKEALQFHKK
ncbi:MAG: STAS domain-containing protein [Chlamydiia bacterium]|nr:STAS domain-containing protein [Chlamydiia bacterium]